jgi:exopolysaccharide biosynthesis polyprenyl glycosylphosphotransferase
VRRPAGRRKSDMAKNVALKPARSRPASDFWILATAGDALIAAACLYAAFLIRTRVALPLTESLLPRQKVHFNVMNVGIVVAAQLLSLGFMGLYGVRERFRDPLPRLLLPALGIEFALLATAFFIGQPYYFPRTVLLVYMLLDTLLLFLWRGGLASMFPPPRRRVVVVGGGPEARRLIEAMRRHPWSGCDPVGIVDSAGEVEQLGVPVVGRREDLAQIVARLDVDDIVLAPEAPTWRDSVAERLPEDIPANLLVWPSPFETLIGNPRFRFVGDVPLLEAHPRAIEGIAAGFKRALDLVVATFCLIVTAPVVFAGALAMAVTSPGSIFYRQERVGRNGARFVIWKLRTMRPHAERASGAVLSRPGDPRVTRVGRLLRSLRIDELPQMWNVLVGEMSLVGPRPERPEFVAQFKETVSAYHLRFLGRPGITGLAQISGDYASDAAVKLRYDLAYLRNWSLALDFWIMLKTLPVVLTRRGV